MAGKLSHLLDNKIASALLLIASYALIYNPLTKFPYTFLIIIAFVLLATWLQEGGLRGFNFKKLGMKEAGIILLLFIVLESVMDFIIQPAVTKIFNEPADYSPFTSLDGNTPKYFKYLLYMWMSAAIGEELLFRGFTFMQLQNLIGNRKMLIMLISAVTFSLAHWDQGIVGLIITFLFGLAFGFIYMKFKNIWINIIVHGLIDTLFLTLAYYGCLSFYS
jgi:membrane protease YdiL (CAAX protease family)